MSEQTNDAPTTPTPQVDYERLGETIGSGLANAIRETAPRRKITAGEYAERERTRRNAPKLEFYLVMQNDRMVNEDSLNAKEIALLNRINRSGRYINRKVEVLLDANVDGSALRFRYKNGSPDDRFELRGEFRSFEDMLTQIVEAQAIENEDEAVHKAAIEEIKARGRGTNATAAQPAQRNHFGKGK
jgi:hypothetical protein